MINFLLKMQNFKLTLAQRLQVKPVTPGLHWHWPLVILQVRPDDPTGWQSHAIHISMCHFCVKIVRAENKKQNGYDSFWDRKAKKRKNFIE